MLQWVGWVDESSSFTEEALTPKGMMKKRVFAFAKPTTKLTKCKYIRHFTTLPCARAAAARAETRTLYTAGSANGEEKSCAEKKKNKQEAEDDSGDSRQREKHAAIRLEAGELSSLPTAVSYRMRVCVCWCFSVLQCTSGQ